MWHFVPPTTLLLDVFRLHRSHRHDPDRSLARRMARGSEDAFAEFWEQIFPVIYRYALSRSGGDAELAEDATQMTLTRVVQRIHTYRGEASLLTWTLTICRRVLYDNWSRDRRRGLEVPLEAEQNTEPALRALLETLSVDVAASAEARQATRQIVRLALDHLPPRQRIAVERRYLLDQSVREIAAALGVTEKAAESLLSRGRVAFRDAFRLLDGNLDERSGLQPTAERST